MGKVLGSQRGGGRLDRLVYIFGQFLCYFILFREKLNFIIFRFFCLFDCYRGFLFVFKIYLELWDGCYGYMMLE